jgi:hypothetical protein
MPFGKPLLVALLALATLGPAACSKPASDDDDATSEKKPKKSKKSKQKAEKDEKDEKPAKPAKPDKATDDADDADAIEQASTMAKAYGEYLDSGLAPDEKKKFNTACDVFKKKGEPGVLALASRFTASEKSGGDKVLQRGCLACLAVMAKTGAFPDDADLMKKLARTAMKSKIPELVGSGCSFANGLKYDGALDDIKDADERLAAGKAKATDAAEKKSFANGADVCRLSKY